MKTNNIQKITLTALFAALTCVATYIIKIPTVTGGYIHLGDSIVVLCGIFLGPVYGAIAAGFGSGLSDVLGGYFIYAPATLVIKALAAFLVSLVYRKFAKNINSNIIRCAISGIFSTLVVVIGYLLFEIVLYQGAAFVEIPANLIQGASGLIISTILLPVLLKVPSFRDLASSK